VSNRDLWDRVSKTDPRAVKPITGKQYSGNSPKPYYIVERLTEEFGPCGLGWGFTVENERFERFSDTDSLHVALVEFWYVNKDQQVGRFQQMGQTKASYMSGAGKFILDEDAPKKSVTDALVKCASYLGFAGDIFSGRWDDSKYVADLKKEFAEPKATSLAPALEASIEAERKKRVDALDELALDIIDRWKMEDREAVCKLWFDDSSFKNSDERAYCWGLLKTESALRAHLQANSPHRDHSPPPNVVKMAPGPGLKKIGVRATTEGIQQ
jgi:hypothetical protein